MCLRFELFFSSVFWWFWFFSLNCCRCDLKILSDANHFFIETILKHYGLFECFSEIITNPTLVDPKGTLKIFPYHDYNLSPHGCELCPRNMCKVWLLLIFIDLFAHFMLFDFFKVLFVMLSIISSLDNWLQYYSWKCWLNDVYQHP